MSKILDIPIGKLLFRYLGAPLTAKKLTIAQILPLIERIDSKVKHWSCKFLSYAIIIILIKSVLARIKGFWAQMFLIPKKVTRKVELICKKNLRSGSEGGSKNAFVSWEAVCSPMFCGGL